MCAYSHRKPWHACGTVLACRHADAQLQVMITTWLGIDGSIKRWWHLLNTRRMLRSQGSKAPGAPEEQRAPARINVSDSNLLSGRIDKVASDGPDGQSMVAASQARPKNWLLCDL